MNFAKEFQSKSIFFYHGTKHTHQPKNPIGMVTHAN
jgi:hypothetical protein